MPRMAASRSPTRIVGARRPVLDPPAGPGGSRLSFLRRRPQWELPTVAAAPADSRPPTAATFAPCSLVSPNIVDHGAPGHPARLLPVVIHSVTSGGEVQLVGL